VTRACARTTVRDSPRALASAQIRAELVHDRVGQQVRDAVDADLAVPVGQDHRPGDVGDGGAQVDAGRLAERGPEAEADRRVMVAAGEHQRNPGAGERREGLVEQCDGV